MKTIELNVEKRSAAGKGAARRSRAEGRIPGVVYGAGKSNVPISVEHKALSDAFRAGAGENAIFLLKLAGSDQSRHAMIRELQRHPVSRKPVHIDFVRVLMDVKITIKVPVEVTGVASGVKNEGGILDVVTREIEVECLPANIPAHIAVDVTNLAIGDAIRISELPALEGVTIVDNPEKVVAHVAHPTREEEPVAAEAVAGAETTEPEVLKKGKAATEEEGGEEKPEKKEKDKEK
ncbi:MAG TPA: 50S ribosomal protein L25 [Thermoanaerobaculia bacterium]|jgi:large subunit ribosomal protein L25|nr:50S ribosomal protein L25 [Thermoanaerobaculia bacterium]